MNAHFKGSLAYTVDVAHVCVYIYVYIHMYLLRVCAKRPLLSVLFQLSVLSLLHLSVSLSLSVVSVASLCACVVPLHLSIPLVCPMRLFARPSVRLSAYCLPV